MLGREFFFARIIPIHSDSHGESRGQISKSQATEPLLTSCMRFFTGRCTG